MASALAPARQPFGILDQSKLRNLQSVKNCQNSIASTKSSLKRGYASLGLSDSENVDPVKLDGVKRTKTGSRDGGLKSATSAVRPVATPKPRLSSRPSTTAKPVTSIAKVAAARPENHWPAPAGRSPPRGKPSGLSSGRRTRLNVPKVGRSSHGRLSLDAAISNTMAGIEAQRSAALSTRNQSMPASWFFEIYEYESPEKEKMAHMLSKETDHVEKLDISNDRPSCHSQAVLDEEPSNEEQDKENIPPVPPVAVAEVAAPIQKGVSRKDMMTEEPRSPLGDLPPSDFYAEGHDATSVVLVDDDAAEPEQPAPEAVMAAAEVTGRLLTAELPQQSGVGADFSPTLPSSLTQQSKGAQTATESAGSFEIWESDSAKDE